MEWIQRNPKKAAALAGLAVLLVLVLVRGMTGGSDKRAGDRLGEPLATPTTTPTHVLSALPSPSAPPTGVSDIMQALKGDGTGSFDASFGSGSSQSLTRHHVTIAAHSDGPLMAVGWWIPFADGARTGSDSSHSKSVQHSDGTYGDSDLARILAFGGPYSKKTWCTVTVDGRVTERQEAAGPYGRVFCQG